MLTKKEIEEKISYAKSDFTDGIEILLEIIEQLEKENKILKIQLKGNLDKDKKTCFNEDGHTGKCLGYSTINDDEPCEYCKTCEALSIKEENLK